MCAFAAMQHSYAIQIHRQSAKICSTLAVVPRAQNHYGSSHVGDLPYRDRKKWDVGALPYDARRRTRAIKSLNRTSASEPGRQAWNVEWAGHAALLSLLRPQDLEKYKLTDKVGGPHSAGRVVGIRNLEAGLNALEAATGLDLDGDGDVGLTNAAPARAPAAAYTLARGARPGSAPIYSGKRERCPRWPRGPWTEVEAAPKVFLPNERERMPGYAGFMTNRRDTLGAAPFAMEPVGSETEQRRLQYAADQTWARPASAGRSSMRKPANVHTTWAAAAQESLYMA